MSDAVNIETISSWPDQQYKPAVSAARNAWGHAQPPPANVKRTAVRITCIEEACDSESRDTTSVVVVNVPTDRLGLFVSVAAKMHAVSEVAVLV